MALELASTLIAAILQGVVLSALVGDKPECLENVEEKPWLSSEVRVRYMYVVRVSSWYLWGNVPTEIALRCLRTF